MKTTQDLICFRMASTRKNNTINVSQDVEMRELYYAVDRKF